MAAVCDAVRQVMRCDVCGDEVPIPLGRLKWVSAVMSAFADAHPDEPHAGRRTWVSPQGIYESMRDIQKHPYSGVCGVIAIHLLDSYRKQVCEIGDLVRDCLELAVERGQPDCAFTDPSRRYVELQALAKELGVYDERKG